jgi:hypothetical protein
LSKVFHHSLAVGNAVMVANMCGEISHSVTGVQYRLPVTFAAEKQGNQWRILRWLTPGIIGASFRTASMPDVSPAPTVIKPYDRPRRSMSCKQVSGKSSHRIIHFSRHAVAGFERLLQPAVNPNWGMFTREMNFAFGQRDVWQRGGGDVVTRLC